MNHPRPFCCYSRLGFAKAVYDSEEEAQAAIERGREKYGDPPMEPYACKVNAGYWHIRRIRAQEHA